MPAPHRRGRLVPPETWEQRNEDEAAARVARFVELAGGPPAEPEYRGDEITDDSQVSAALARYQLRRG